LILNVNLFCKAVRIWRL